MDLEGIMLGLNKSDGERQLPCDFTHYVESKKTKQMNKQNKTKTNSQIQRSDQWLPEGKRVVGGCVQNG